MTWFLVGGSLLGHAQSRSIDEAAKLYPFDVDGGAHFFAHWPVTNSFPYTSVTGDGAGNELQSYMMNLRDGKTVSEIMPFEQDTNGNWGPVTDGMQVSLRFRQSKFTLGEKILACMILRNTTSGSSNQWWRNGAPDFGYQFTLRQGTNVFTWMRPQQKHLEAPTGGSRSKYPLGVDPYWYEAQPRTEGLVLAYVNRFFDLDQPGQYSMQVLINMPTMEGKGTTGIVSGTATFEVVEKSSP